ncbi:MAG: hypothetical protein ACRD4R_17500 [Candidatus Acidiferrales bacterium]
MKLFRRKSGADAAPRPNPADFDADLAGNSRRVTLSLSRAGRFAAMLARSRGSVIIQVSDLLAGMYISDWEHLSQYWEDEDREQIEELLRKICQISPQRWNSWIELYDHKHQEGKGAEPWNGKGPVVRKNEDVPLRKSVALEDVLKQAEQIAPFHDRDGERRLPILTSEAVLLCIARSYGTEISRTLAASGLDTPRLEKDALFPRRAPLA